MGVTFAAVGPMVAIGSDPSLGLLGIYGATIVAGIFTILMAPFVSRLLPLFPPVVTGTIITVIGISLVGVGINWAAGGVVTRIRVSALSWRRFLCAALHLADHPISGAASSAISLFCLV